ncbi:helix-turn-helix domain-containing protein [Jannaschia sp. R86511]|uniref:helix-turn-helix domain-containing protein n=1 Tax=Jannaschia sp. R86511 TaxID=3093853 RepID=UPI0036D34DAD
MVNERLRATLRANGVTEAGLAARLAVDPKTVQRWVTKGRTPHRVTALNAAAFLGVASSWLWPGLTDESASSAAGEVVAFYAHRSQVPNHVWLDQVLGARQRIDVFTYAGLFLAEDNPDVIELIRHKASTGVAVRIALGDPHSAEVKLRGREEGMPDEIPMRVSMSLHYFRTLADADGVDLRLHRTTLYNSFYRFDDEMLINQHALGVYGYQAPILHLRDSGTGDLFATYLRSLEHGWKQAYELDRSLTD